MDTNDQDILEEQTAPPRKRKKKKSWIIVLVIVILAAALGTGYYFMERQKPISTARNYLDDIKAMNFDGMKELLQSNDMTALDNADITNDAYAAFFQKVNQKMTYKITKTKFDIKNGTATVTAHIKYIDGSDIYKETIAEFVKQIVASAFSGTSLSEDETNQKLASLLEEKSDTVEDKFAETDISYPLIQAGDKWKIVSLDEETVKIMSANFVNVQDEINQELTNSENQANSDSPAPSSSTDGTIDMSNDKFTIHYTQCRVVKDISGASCLLVYYDYTNNTSSHLPVLW